MGDAYLVEMVVLRVSPYLREDRPLMWLAEKNADTPRLLPIAIGEFEAAAIQMTVSGEEPERPVSYDLLTHMLDRLNVPVERIIIDKVDRSVFYARVIIAAEGKEQAIDSRPSDAVALAVRTHSRIYVDSELLDTVGIAPALGDEDIEQSMERFHQFEPQVVPRRSSPEQQDLSTVVRNPKPRKEPTEVSSDALAKLHRCLERAVICENYEEAARLRDEIASREKDQSG